MSQKIKTPAPVVVLIAPQMGENIGAAARAMLNCGVTELRIVNPRDGWPNERADAMSAGALETMPPVGVFESTQDAIADCHYVLATTARPRDMVKDVFTARGAAEETQKRLQDGQRVAILFGPERAGLTTEDVALAQGIITIPLNPGFSSLNLGQAVLLVCHEWYQLIAGIPDQVRPSGDSVIATRQEFDGLMQRLEAALTDGGFFRSEEMQPTVMRNIRTLFSRADLTDQEVRTLHGIVSSLTGLRKPAG